MRLFPLVMVLLTACTTTPEQVVSQGNSYILASDQTVEQTAECLARSTEDASAKWVSRTSEAGSAKRVLVGQDSRDATIAVFDIQPAATGSMVTAYLGNAVITKRMALDAMIADCPLRVVD